MPAKTKMNATERAMILSISLRCGSDIVDDPTGKFLKVKYIQKKSVTCVEQPYLFDAGSKIQWTPNAEKLTASEGVAFASYDDEWFGQPVSVVEMDGKVDAIEELVYVESQLCSTGTKYYGETDRADGEEQGRARLGERHGPLPDLGLAEDPGGVRDPLQVSGSAQGPRLRARRVCECAADDRGGWGGGGEESVPGSVCHPRRAGERGGWMEAPP